MIYICGRKVKVRTGQPGRPKEARTQTVNICTNKNIIGRYDWVIRLYKSNFTSEEELQDKQFKTIEELIEYLKRKYYGKVEKSPSGRIIDDNREERNRYSGLNF